MIILHFDNHGPLFKFLANIESMAKLLGDLKVVYKHFYCKTYIGLQRGGHPRFY